jgi:hypothetical protein
MEMKTVEHSMFFGEAASEQTTVFVLSVQPRLKILRLLNLFMKSSSLFVEV